MRSVILMGSLMCALMIFAGIPTNVASAPAADKATLEAIARSYLWVNVATLGVDNKIPEIQLSMIKEARSFYVTRFTQTYNGLPVYNTTALVMISKDGLRPVDAASQFKRPSAVINTKIDAQAALKIATGAIAEKVIPRGSPKTEQMLCTVEAPSVKLSTSGDKIPSHGATASPQAARVCWQVNVPTLDPLGDWSILVDGPTGKVISRQNLIFFDTGDGWVYRYGNPIQTGGNLPWPPPDDIDHDILTWQETRGLPPHPEWPPVQLLNLNPGTGRLRGSFVDLNSTWIVGGYKPSGLADDPSRQYFYTRADDRFEEVMVYYYVDSVHSYLQQIGEGELLNYPVPAHAHYFDEANAFYSSWDLGLHFGDGPYLYDDVDPNYPIDTAEDVDVIIHEYGHAIHGDQGLFSGYVSEEMGAFSEGFSDYLAVSFLDQGAAGTEGCVFEWFGYEFGGSYPYCMRNTFSTKHYPEDLTYEVHDDGEMWSAALWRLRTLLGKDVVDLLAVETGYYLWPWASFRDAVKAMVQADRVTYGGAHESTIRQVFRENGMFAYWIDSQAYPWGPWWDSPINYPLADNNGFETGSFAPVWGVEASDPAVTPMIVTAPVYAGTYAAELVGSSGGSATESMIYYEFTMPADATWVRLRFHYRIDTIDSYYYDWFEWRLGTSTSWWYSRWLWDTGGSFYENWVEVPVWFLQGQSCGLTFLLHDDGFPGDPTYVYLDGSGGVDDISLRWSNLHAPVTINGETVDTPPSFSKRVPDGTALSVSAPSQVVIGSMTYHFMEWWPDGELDSTHPLFTPTEDTYLEADYNQANPGPVGTATLASLASFAGWQSGGTLLILGDIITNPHGLKPSGVAYQQGRDMTPLGYLSGMLDQPQQTVYDTNPTYIDSNGRPVGNWIYIFAVGGPLANAVTHYYETTSTAADRAPLTFSSSGGNFIWTDKNGVVVETISQSSNAIPPGTSDVFVIQTVKDADSRLVALIYGCRYMGTWAAAVYFKFVVYPDIANWQQGYYIVSWTDATSGQYADGTPDIGDTFTIIAQGTP